MSVWQMSVSKNLRRAGESHAQEMTATTDKIDRIGKGEKGTFIFSGCRVLAGPVPLSYGQKTRMNTWNEENQEERRVHQQGLGRDEVPRCESWLPATPWGTKRAIN